MNDLRDGKFSHRWYQSTWQPIRDKIAKWCNAKSDSEPNGLNRKIKDVDCENPTESCGAVPVDLLADNARRSQGPGQSAQRPERQDQ
jgi:protein involved in sex pheromone biosynthesis